MSFRAGDHVRHRPSGEEWIVAVDSENGRVSWSGWPEGMAAEEDCELQRAASDEERLRQLRACASMPGTDGDPRRGADHRKVAAQRQLHAEGENWHCQAAVGAAGEPCGIELQSGACPLEAHRCS